MPENLLIACLLLIYLGVAANVLTMILLSHITKKLSYAIVGGVLSGFIIVVTGSLSSAFGSSVHSTSDLSALTFVTCLSYLAYSFCFWTLINLNVTSLRIRIVREILSCPSAQVSASDLHHAYNPEVALTNRIERMVAGGQLIKTEEEKYRIGAPFVLLIAKILYFLRQMTLPRHLRK